MAADPAPALFFYIRSAPIAPDIAPNTAEAIIPGGIVRDTEVASAQVRLRCAPAEWQYVARAVMSAHETVRQSFSRHHPRVPQRRSRVHQVWRTHSVSSRAP